MNVDTTQPTPQSLVISYGGTLRAMARGDVVPADLAGGLFYFGCTRPWFMDESSWKAELELNTVLSEQEKEAHYRALRKAVLEAEAAGRVAWRTNERYNKWDRLNGLLVANHWPALVSPDAQDPEWYSYSGVAEAVALQNLSLRVIWCG